MKLRSITIGLVLFILVGKLSGQTHQAERLFVPYIDVESQSNVDVTVSGAEQACQQEYTNTLSNTNLFSSREQNLIREIFAKYKNVTTNSGPSGTVCASHYLTNYLVHAGERTVRVENWIANFQYTNFNAQEQIILGGGGLSAKFRTKSDGGYNMYFIRTGNGTMLRFSEVKNGLINGVLVAFEDLHPQGTNWNFRNADFTDSCLTEYRQYTNGMVFGKFLMWNSRNNLILEANFKEPYDFEKHRIDLQMIQQHSQ